MLLYTVYLQHFFIELRMEMGNVPKRQQRNHRKKNNSRRSPTGLQCSEKFPHPEASFSRWLTENKVLLYIQFFNSISLYLLSVVNIEFIAPIYRLSTVFCLYLPSVVNLHNCAPIYRLSTVFVYTYRRLLSKQTMFNRQSKVSYLYFTLNDRWHLFDQ